MHKKQHKKGKIMQTQNKWSFQRKISLTLLLIGVIGFSATVVMAYLALSPSLDNQATSGIIACVALAALLTSFVLGYIIARKAIRRITMLTNGLQNESERFSDTATGISDVTDNLTESSTKQATAWQETSTAIEEINAMIKKNAENAKESLKVAESSTAISNKGQVAVSEMIGVINDINSSNDNILNKISESNARIGEIAKVIAAIGSKTKVINEIVFQTKLLSFNASVEAARAGEHGKGFAVVAEEVGNLAQMSGNAAKEISEMLAESISKVEAIVKETKQMVEQLVSEGGVKIQFGVIKAKMCGDILTEIVSNVSELSSRVGEISVASSEQSKGVNEITKAMNALDKDTHANAKSIERISGYVTTLKDESKSFSFLIVDLVKIVLGGGLNKDYNAKSSKIIKIKNFLKNKSSTTHKLKSNIAKKGSVAEPKVSHLKAVSGSDVTPDADDPRFKDL
ncbi:MAG: hypothetical protein A2Z20_10280 [Bdellovibrionales bacterium RBG_16_40_8]|nr:MAG: hypothetical protein A2Z20_10280 [Bdellovibrionales bacterium RBG_16_40_8]